MKKILPLLLLSSNVYALDCSIYPEQKTFSHIEQSDIINGKYSLQELKKIGEHLFVNKFNSCDGVGRPATTGTGNKRTIGQPDFIRTSGMDSNSCSGCHAQPKIGGSGDFVSNVFVLAQAKDPVIFDISNENSNERNTLGMNGSGLIELLAKEMTKELQSQAKNSLDGITILKSKNVEFKIQKENGIIVQSWGIDKDLIVKPFHQSGVVNSIRTFTVNAFNHHHGMQAEERFDLNPQKNMDSDFDEDGITRELSIGDITAVTIWQATLPIPKQIIPIEKKDSIKMGENLFHEIECDSCHIPNMKLSSSIFTEPNEYNLPDTFSDQSSTYSVDLKIKNVKAYTDLKRHDLCDNEIRHFCNEKLNQGRPDSEFPGSEYFITRKLWDVGNSAPYGHRGDLTTITEAILAHGGEARNSREKFIQLNFTQKKNVLDFLNSLVVQ